MYSLYCECNNIFNISSQCLWYVFLTLLSRAHFIVSLFSFLFPISFTFPFNLLLLFNFLFLLSLPSYLHLLTFLPPTSRFLFPTPPYSSPVPPTPFFSLYSIVISYFSVNISWILSNVEDNTNLTVSNYMCISSILLS